MAKKTTKTTAKATVGDPMPGKLPKGEAASGNRAFLKRMMNSGATNLPNFPQAICFTLAELRAFLDSAEKTINPDPTNPVPPEQQGIAICPAFRRDSFTISLVATRFSVNPLTGKIASINNPVTGIHYPEMDPLTPAKKTLKKSKSKLMTGPGEPDPGGEQPPVGDDAYDNGSQYP
jgi:hypothetical protein